MSLVPHMTSASSSSRAGSVACCSVHRREREAPCTETMERVGRSPSEELCPGIQSNLETAATPEHDPTPATTVGHGGARKGELAAGERSAGGDQEEAHARAG